MSQRIEEASRGRARAPLSLVGRIAIAFERGRRPMNSVGVRAWLGSFAKQMSFFHVIGSDDDERRPDVLRLRHEDHALFVADVTSAPNERERARLASHLDVLRPFLEAGEVSLAIFGVATSDIESMERWIEELGGLVARSALLTGPPCAHSGDGCVFVYYELLSPAPHREPRRVAPRPDAKGRDHRFFTQPECETIVDRLRRLGWPAAVILLCPACGERLSVASRSLGTTAHLEVRCESCRRVPRHPIARFKGIDLDQD